MLVLQLTINIGITIALAAKPNVVNGIGMAVLIAIASGNFINNATCTHDFESTHCG